MSNLYSGFDWMAADATVVRNEWVLWAIASGILRRVSPAMTLMDF